MISRRDINTDKPERVVHPKHYNEGIEMWDYAYTHKLDFLKVTLLNMLRDGKPKTVLKI